MTDSPADGWAMPYIWMPNSAMAMAVSKNLHGVAFNPLQTLMPEYW